MSAARPDPNDPDATPELPRQAVDYHAPVTPPPTRGNQTPTPGAVHVRREAEPTVLRRRPARRFSETLLSPMTARRTAHIPPWVGALLAVALGSLVGWALSVGLGSSGDEATEPPRPSAPPSPATELGRTPGDPSLEPIRAPRNAGPSDRPGAGSSESTASTETTSRRGAAPSVRTEATARPSPTPRAAPTARSAASVMPRSVAADVSPQPGVDPTLEPPAASEPDDEAARAAAEPRHPPPSAEPAPPERESGHRSWLSDTKPKAWVK